MKKIHDYVGYSMGAILFVMLLSVSWQVFTRYVLNDPSSITDELSRYLLIWLGMLGGAYVAGKHEHLAIDILPERLNPENRQRLQVLINWLVVLFVAGAMVIGGGRLVYVTHTLGQTSAAMQIPLSWVYSIIPISGALIVLFKLRPIKH